MVGVWNVECGIWKWNEWRLEIGCRPSFEAVNWIERCDHRPSRPSEFCRGNDDVASVLVFDKVPIIHSQKPCCSILIGYRVRPSARGDNLDKTMMTIHTPLIMSKINLFIYLFCHLWIGILWHFIYDDYEMLKFYTVKKIFATSTEIIILFVIEIEKKLN